MNFCGCHSIDSLGNNIECKINNYWLKLDVRSEKEKAGINICAWMAEKISMPFTGILNINGEDCLKKRRSGWGVLIFEADGLSSEDEQIIRNTKQRCSCKTQTSHFLLIAVVYTSPAETRHRGASLVT